MIDYLDSPELQEEGTRCWLRYYPQPADSISLPFQCLKWTNRVVRVAGLIAIIIQRKRVLIFFFDVCDRPYRAITVDKRSSVAKNAGRLSPDSPTWLLRALGDIIISIP
jgi:hypothetical protein